MRGLASILAAKGRGRDTELVHMTPGEVKALHGIATLHGGSLTVNPATGLPEAGFLTNILPIVAGMASEYFMPGNPWGAAAIGGGVGMATHGGSLSAGLMGALGGYGGATLGAGMFGSTAVGAPVANAAGAVTSEGQALNAAAGAPTLNAGLTDTSLLNAYPSLSSSMLNSGLTDVPYNAATGATASDILNNPLDPNAANLQAFTNNSPAAFADPASGIQSLGPAADNLVGPPSALKAAANAVANPVADSGLTGTVTRNGITDTLLNGEQTGAYQPMPADAKPPGGWWDKLTNMDTYFDPKTGRMTLAGGAGVMGLAQLIGAQSTGAANRRSITEWNAYSPFSPTSAYRTTKPWHAAAGGLASVYPNRLPEREVVQDPTAPAGTEPHVDPFTGQQQNMAGGGIAGQPRYLHGPGDGMSDSIPASIDGKQPAALANSEFVVPADIVSHLGNGSSEAGAKHLYAMMDRIRKARTGTAKQGKQINAQKFMPA